MSQYESFDNDSESQNTSWSEWSTISESELRLARATDETSNSNAEQAEKTNRKRPRLAHESIQDGIDAMEEFAIELRDNPLTDERTKNVVYSVFQGLMRKAEGLKQGIIQDEASKAARKIGIAAYEMLDSPLLAERVAIALAMFAEGANQEEVQAQLDEEWSERGVQRYAEDNSRVVSDIVEKATKNGIDLSKGIAQTTTSEQKEENAEETTVDSAIEKIEAARQKRTRLPFESVRDTITALDASAAELMSSQQVDEKTKKTAVVYFEKIKKEAQGMEHDIAMDDCNNAAKRMGINAPLGLINNPATVGRTAIALTMLAEGSSREEVVAQLDEEFVDDGDEISAALNRLILSTILKD